MNKETYTCNQCEETFTDEDLKNSICECCDSLNDKSLIGEIEDCPECGEEAFFDRACPNCETATLDENKS